MGYLLPASPEKILYSRLAGSLAQDKVFTVEMAELQKLPVGRTALQRRILALDSAVERHISALAHDVVVGHMALKGVAPGVCGNGRRQRFLRISKRRRRRKTKSWPGFSLPRRLELVPTPPSSAPASDTSQSKTCREPAVSITCRDRRNQRGAVLPMLPGIATQPEYLGARNVPQPVATGAVSGSPKPIFRDLNGNAAGLPESALPVARSGVAALLLLN